MLVIGYQGEVGSNAEQAAHEMAKNLEFTEVLYKPLVSSHNVIRELTTGKIDYGVVAIKNNLGGRVEETFNAIKDEPLELVDTTILTIHHCLFKKRGVDDSELAFISSHIQALLQTQQSREKLYPHLVEKEAPDTAIAAQWLAEGRLDKNVAVLCKKSAGNDNNLELIRENLEDKLSQTEFRMYKLSNIDYDNAQKPSVKDQLIYMCLNQTGIGALGKTIIILGIMATLFFGGSAFFDSLDVATSIGGAISTTFLFLTSKKARSLVMYKSLKGYWKYYSIPDEGRESCYDLLYETPRIVEIDEVDGELFLRGWICDKAAIPFFETSKTIVSSSEKSRGCLVYWYCNPSEIGRDVALSGFTELNWQKKYLAAPINRMSGRYSGITTKETGRVTFLRISQDEFEVHRRCEFLGKTENH